MEKYHQLNIIARPNELNTGGRQRGQNLRNKYLLNESLRAAVCPFVANKKNFNEYSNLFDLNQCVDLVKKNLKNHFSLDAHID